MDLAEFEDLVDRFGDDIGRWPPERRAAAQAYLATSDAARALLRQAAGVRQMFETAPRPMAPPDLAARILARAAAEPPPAAPPSAAGRSGQMPVRLTAVFVGCFIVGFAFGNGRALEPDASQMAAPAAATVYTPLFR